MLYIFSAESMILGWIPWRFYYLIKIKSRLFGYSDTIKYQEPFISLFILVLIAITIVYILRIKQKYWLAILTATTMLSSLYLGLRKTDLINQFFGLKSAGNEIILLAWTMTVVICFALFININDRQEL
jgi:hypothetical protein